MAKNGLSRRSFIALAATGAGGMVFLARCNNLERYSTYRFFTDEEAIVVDALVDQIIPPDDWPGAKTAGVTNFIDRQLNGTYNRFQENYRKGITSVQATCGEIYGRTFENLEWSEQTEFLKLMESGKLADMKIAKSPSGKEEYFWNNNFDREFFNLLRDHTMQGFYGSPRHGGNLNYVSYKMVRLDYPLIIGQNRYNG